MKNKIITAILIATAFAMLYVVPAFCTGSVRG